MNLAPISFLSGLGVVGIYQHNQCPPMQNRLHLRETVHRFGLFLGFGQLVIREPEMITSINPDMVCDYRFTFGQKG